MLDSTRHLLPSALILLLALPCCTNHRGRGGGGDDDVADDDASGDDTADDDAVADDDDGQHEITTTLSHDFTLRIDDVTEFGSIFGLVPCDTTMGGTVTRDDEQSACATCEAVWTGPITETFTDCQGVTFGDTFTYGFELLDAGVGVWEWSEDEQTWSLEGEATWQGDGFVLDKEEPMGEGKYQLATTWMTYSFQ